MPGRICGIEVDVDGELHAVVGRPVEAGHAVELAAAEAAEPDVVAAFADELVEAAVAVEHVVSLDRVELELIVEVVADGAGPGADLDPVVAFAAQSSARWSCCRGRSRCRRRRRLRRAGRRRAR